jgi:hypothetical protein
MAALKRLQWSVDIAARTLLRLDLDGQLRCPLGCSRIPNGHDLPFLAKALGAG